MLRVFSLVLVTAVPLLYVLRTDDQRPLRGKCLLGITAVVAVMPPLAWYCALGTGPAAALHQAAAAAVPLAQLGALVLSTRTYPTLRDQRFAAASSFGSLRARPRVAFAGGSLGSCSAAIPIR